MYNTVFITAGYREWLNVSIVFAGVAVLGDSLFSSILALQ